MEPSTMQTGESKKTGMTEPIVETIMIDLVNEFRRRMVSAFPIKHSTHFYEDGEIMQWGALAMKELEETFIQKLCSLDGNNQGGLPHLQQQVLLKMLNVLINEICQKNTQLKEKAQALMQQIIAHSTTSYKTYLEQYFASRPSMTKHAQVIMDMEALEVIMQFDQLEIGHSQFQQEYRNMLESRLEEINAQVKGKFDEEAKGNKIGVVEEPTAGPSKESEPEPTCPTRKRRKQNFK